MSTVAQHINNHSYLFDTPKNKVTMSLSVFLLKFITNWYAGKLNILRAEVLGFIIMLEKKELTFDSTSYNLFRRIFRMVYSFNEALSKEDSTHLYKVKLSLNALCVALISLLAMYEKENYSDHNEPIDIVDLNDWPFEEQVLTA